MGCRTHSALRGLIFVGAIVLSTYSNATCADGRCAAFNEHPVAVSAVPPSDVGVQESGGSVIDAAKQSLAKYKRQSIYLNATDEDGTAYSYGQESQNPIVPYLYPLVLVALLTAILIYFLVLFGAAQPVQKPVKDGLQPLLQKTGPDISPPDVSETTSIAPTWQDLVRGCDGDPIRAATIISGEVAIDPTLDPGSDVAIARAFTRLQTS